MSLTPGARLGPYEIIARIGKGGMGEVHRARHLKLRRDVAIKVLPADLAGDPVRLARFEREARTASAAFPRLSPGPSDLTRTASCPTVCIGVT